MWHPFDFIGGPIGRVRAVSLGHLGQVHVWADNGLFNVWYFRSAHVTKLCPAADAAVAFNPATGLLTLKQAQFRMHGACGPLGEMYTAPLVTDHPSGERLVPDPDADSLHVTDAAGNVRQTIPNYRASSESWAVATFVGNDLSVLLVADPHAVRLFKYFAEKGTETPRWKVGGGSTEQQLLFRAVLDNPDEDTPRLMYADWLDENGDPARAEFIRLQCRYDEHLRGTPLPYTDPTVRRMDELARQMKARWLAELPAVHGVRWVGFRRGFPTAEVTSPTTLVRAARRVWAAAPVDDVTVSGLQAAGARALAGSPVARRLRHLTLDRYSAGRDGDGPLRALFHTAAVSNLRTLTVATCDLPDDALAVVASSPFLTNLEWLNTGYGAVGDASAAALLASPALAHLRGGPFRGNGPSAEMKDKLKARFPFA